MNKQYVIIIAEVGRETLWKFADQRLKEVFKGGIGELPSSPLVPFGGDEYSERLERHPQSNQLD